MVINAVVTEVVYRTVRAKVLSDKEANRTILHSTPNIVRLAVGFFISEICLHVLKDNLSSNFETFWFDIPFVCSLTVCVCLFVVDYVCMCVCSLTVCVYCSWIIVVIYSSAIFI